MKKFASIVLGGLIGLFFIGFLSCQKTKQTAGNPITPLNALLNSDTTLSLYQRMLLRGNDVGLLADASSTLLIPRNEAMRQAGYVDVIIDSMSSSYADRIMRYQYLPAGLTADTGVITVNPTLLGPPLYAQKQNNGAVLLNNYASTIGDEVQVGQAKVYYISTPLTPAADSLPQIFQFDTTLTFLSRAFARTNFYDSALLTGSYTLLAPMNDAFRKAGYDSIGAIDSADINTLVQLVSNQVIKGTYFSGNFPATVQRLQGSDLSVVYNGGFPQFSTGTNPAPVNLVFSNQVAGSNLILHWTDGILSP